MKHITLVKAFQLRKKLSQNVDSMKSVLYNMSAYAKSEEELKRFQEKYFDGKTTDEFLQEYLVKHANLTVFKTAIEVANVVTRPVFIEIARLQSDAATLESLVSTYKREDKIHRVLSAVDSKGDRVYEDVEYIESFDIKQVKEALSQVKRQLIELDDKANKLNATTEVNLDDTLYDWIFVTAAQ